ncbi:MAG: hypothetical protein M9933_01595 [Chitinophagaceae bacterium]|nr:hypothetical protein [Chitinophagaceae bacterium]
MSYTIFLKGRFDGLPSGNRLHRAGDTLYGRGITNTPLKDMYLTIVREIYPRFAENRILLEVKEPSKWTVPATDYERDAWYKENMYNLEVIVPMQQAPHLYSEMLQELNRSSGYYGKMEHKNTACMVLSAPAKPGDLHTKGGKTEVQINNEKQFRFKNIPIKTLIAWLNNNSVISIPVIDETGIDFPVDMDFPEGFSDIEQISRRLKRYGLVLQKAERDMEVFVIRERE